MRSMAVPQRFVAKSGGTACVGRIFIYSLRNGCVHTTADAFSAWTRPSMGVAMPVAWEQLQALKSAANWITATAQALRPLGTEAPTRLVR